MSEQPTDPKLITSEVIAKLLSELPRLEDAFERAKHALVGGEYPVSEDRLNDWLEEADLTEEEANANSAYLEYDRTSCEFYSTTNYLQFIVPHYLQQHSIEQVADRFPSLRGVKGVFEMEPIDLLNWMEHEACPQGVHAGRFILSLWNNDPAKFNVAEAFAVWDEKHQDAYIQWLKRPVLPQERLWGQF